MKKIALILPLLTFSLAACSQTTKPAKIETQLRISDEPTKVYTLKDYYSNDAALDKKVNEYLAMLDDTSKVAQTIMPAMGRLGQSTDVIFRLVRERKIGGILMLNGTKEQFKLWIDSINAINVKLNTPAFLYSADAEPSLVNRKITGSTLVKKANELKTIDEVREVAKTISDDLKAIGINYNFAPVVDMSPNQTVGWRSFGAIPANIIPWSNAFIQTTQENNIVATAKHFPGHGLVSGDTHKSLQAIDGELKEIKNYPELIKDGVLSIMVGHLAVVNNQKYTTNGLPATLSKGIVQGLLRTEMNFNGIVVTDALNMGGVASVPNCDVKAIEAGCDIALMPVNTDKAFKDILAKYRSDSEFKKQLEESVKRIIRLKICLGIIK
jgi:beta-N-acetylhexosaminidase